MGKLTISMAIFNSYVTNYQRVTHIKIIEKNHDHWNHEMFIVFFPHQLSYSFPVENSAKLGAPRAICARASSTWREVTRAKAFWQGMDTTHLPYVLTVKNNPIMNALAIISYLQTMVLVELWIDWIHSDCHYTTHLWVGIWVYGWNLATLQTALKKWILKYSQNL